MTSKYFIISIGAIVSLMIASCNNTSCDNNRKPYDYAFGIRSDSAAFMVKQLNGFDSIYYQSSYNIIWPERIGSADISTLQHAIASSALLSDSSDFGHMANVFLQQRAVEPKAPETGLESASWEEAQQAHYCNVAMSEALVHTLTTRLLVMELNYYTYTFGAAHGMSTKRFINYDIPDGKILTVADIFKPDTKSAVVDAIRQAASSQYIAEFVDTAKISAFDEFRLTDNGIVFVYQPYDIAPYSSGIIQIPVNAYNLSQSFTPYALKYYNFQ